MKRPYLEPGPTRVMGILNVTPDSFSDGGKWFQVDQAIAHGLAMTDEGAALIDVGGESTRPGASRITAEDEWQRIAPVVQTLVQEDVTVSVDTVNARTAAAALEAGAGVINDISGGLHDPQMASVAAQSEAGFVIQHFRGFPADPQLNETYGQVVPEVVSELHAQIQLARKAGVAAEQIIVDPGLGFALDAENSWALVDHLEEISSLEYPVLVGASRKRFIVARYQDEVLQGTLEVTRRAVAAGAWAVRVHDVAANVHLIASLTKK